MKNKNGFTLIEILAVIIIIGIVAIIAIPSISKYINGSKDTAYTSFEKTMVEAAKNKVVECVTDNVDCGLPAKEEVQQIYLDDLIEEGYLENMKDPSTKEFCEQATSYVTIQGTNAADYKYKACLYCGEYFTDDSSCSEIAGHGGSGDGADPVCGEKTGESTRWSNQNRTITVACSDTESGCLQSVFSKTFTKTTKDGIGTITIRDKSGRTKTCNVNAYIDKNPATCEINVLTDPSKTGEYIEETGWYSLKATAAIQNQKDNADESGLLTYGMGTSLANRDYNKKNELTVGKGITTVIGYTKDVAGNEGTCAKEIRVGTEIPKFNLFYGYLIFPNKETYVLNGMTQNGSSFTTTSDIPRMIINNVTKYKKVEKVLITLSSAIQQETKAYLKTGGLTKEATMAQGSKEIVFVFTGNEIKSYDNFDIQFGKLSGKTYNVQKIEILTKDNSLWTNKDMTIYVEPIDEGMKTTQATFDAGSNWANVFSKTYTTLASNTVKTKNGIGMISHPVEFTAKIDKVIPTVTVTAKQKTSGTVVPQGVWSSEGLNYTFNKVVQGTSVTKIYYCKDTNNTCTPNIEVADGATVTDFNNITSKYYIRYQVINEAGETSGIEVYETYTDTTNPTCTVQKTNTGTTTGVTTTVTCNDGESGCDTTRSDKGESGKLNGTYTYYVYDKAGNRGSCSVTVVAQNQIRTKSCTAGNRCSGAGCETWKSCSHSECGAASYNRCEAAGCETWKTCANSACGVASYKTCANSACGNKTCATAACGVASYKSCAHANCGYLSCATAGCGVASYKTCNHSDCGTYKKCVGTVNCRCMSSSCQHQASTRPGTATWDPITTYHGTNPNMQCNIGAYSNLVAECPVGYQYMSTPSYGTLTTYNNTCATAACGVASYNTCANSACGNKTCRTAACGVESYNSCAHADCGYKSCATSGCGVASYKSCATSGCGCQTYKAGSVCGAASYKTCRTSGCGCETYKANIGTCGCSTWGSFGSWTNTTSCTAEESSNHATTSECRVVYN